MKMLTDESVRESAQERDARHAREKLARLQKRKSRETAKLAFSTSRGKSALSRVPTAKTSRIKNSPAPE
jgi:hypothetical protein